MWDKLEKLWMLIQMFFIIIVIIVQVIIVALFSYLLYMWLGAVWEAMQL